MIGIEKNMFWKNPKKVLLKNIKKSVEEFLDVLMDGNDKLHGHILADGAILHYNLCKASPEFEVLINSHPGENIPEIAMYSHTQLERLQKEATSNNDFISTITLTFWLINLRCMINESFQEYGIKIWQIVSPSFDIAEGYLDKKLQTALEANNDIEIERLKGAKLLCRFIPPQFRNEVDNEK